MKKCYIKRTVIMMLILAAVMSITLVADASDSDRTDPGYVANYKVFGSLTTNARTATGVTQCDGYCSSISVQVTTTYGEGWEEIYPETASSQHVGTAASARTTTSNLTAVVVRAEGRHYASIDLSSWGPAYTVVVRDLNNL